MPSRDKIKPRVIKELQKVTDKDKEATDEASKLDKDLGIGGQARKAMSKAYTKIAKSYAGGIAVTQSDAGACKTVKASIDLVHKRANGDNS